MKHSHLLLPVALVFLISNQIIFPQMDSLDSLEGSASQNKELYFQHHGFFNLWRIGFFTSGHVSVSSENGEESSYTLGKSVFCIGTILGTRLNDYLRLGAGVEYNGYPETENYYQLTNGMVFPLFLDLRVNFPGNPSPIFIADLGYNLTQGDGFPFVNIGTGIEIGLSDIISIFLELSIRYYWDNYSNFSETNEYGTTYYAKTTYLNLTSGLSF